MNSDEKIDKIKEILSQYSNTCDALDEAREKVSIENPSLNFSQAHFERRAGLDADTIAMIASVVFDQHKGGGDARCMH